MLKTFKYRLYPDKTQQQMLAKAFGCVRFIYNNSLSLKKELYDTYGISISRFNLDKRLVSLKERFKFLKDPPSQALQQAISHLDTAYQNLYNKTANKPQFKNKYTKQSFSLPQGVRLDFKSSKVFIPKLKWTLGILHRKIPVDAVIKTCTVSKNPSGKYFISVLFEDGLKQPIKQLGKEIGLDLGIKDLITLSDGTKEKSGKFLDKYLSKVKILCKKLSAKQKGSKNRIKVRLKLAKVYEKITNCRDDQLHKLSKRIIDENQVIFLEDLSVKSMMEKSGSNQARNIGDVSWRKLINMLVYKAELYGKYVFKVNPYNTSKTCSNCLKIKEDLTLKIRTWQCEHCLAKHDRDINAAKNVLRIGQELPEYKALKAA
jgi:putative transposase